VKIPPVLAAKVDACRFAQSTELRPDAIHQVVLDSADRCRRVGFWKIVETARIGEGSEVEGSVLEIRIGGRSMTIVVTWAPTERGQRVELSVDDYVVSQQTIFAFIPIAPKRVPALPPLERFAQLLKAGLVSP
jgi:hypothetical protein